MTIQQFIEKAIEGGWKAREYHETTYYYPLRRPGASPSRSTTKAYHSEEILLDPFAWKAVGKVEGWDEHEGLEEYKGVRRHVPGWEVNMTEMVVQLCAGKTIEQYLETL